MEEDLLAVVLERLEELGLHADASRSTPGAEVEHDVDLVLSRGAARQRFAMELRGHATLSGLTSDLKTETRALPLLVGAGSVSPRSAEAFRRAGIQFVDASGNASIHFADVLIDIRGRRSARDPAGSSRGRGGNLFSTARAQVAFAVLQWPACWRKPQREVAETAGVSLGQVNDALKMFRESGFGPGGHRTDAELLDLWVASFPRGLGEKLVLATYRGSVEDFRVVDAHDPVFAGGPAVSGEFAADDLIQPTSLTIYVPELDPMLPVKNRWRTDGAANIIVRRMFWRAPSDEICTGDGPAGALRPAPDVLVYADLMASDDPRVRSVALEWRRRLAGPQHAL